MLDGVKRVHLIGIGGIGVSGVARLLHGEGYHVSGSDVRESQITEALRAEGMTVAIGHDPAHLEGVDLVVYSTAIPAGNPELVAARERGIPLVHRAQVLGELADAHHAIGVLGTHGKGTVSAMIAWILDTVGKNPGFYIGGLVNNYGTNARWGSGPLVLEVDESDGSHRFLHPQIVVINNLEADHLNYYDDFDAIVDSLAQFVRENDQARFFINGDCDGCRRLIPVFDAIGAEWGAFGFSDDVSVRASELETRALGSQFDVSVRGRSLGTIDCALPGAYNAANAIAATAVALSMDLPFAAVQQALSSFRGLENRFQLIDSDGVRIIKDYISHPTGIRRVLAAARDCNPKRIFAVFKPYRFTLIHYLQDEYAVAFRDADHTLLTEMYTAGEVPIPGVDENFLLEKIRSAGSTAEWIPEMGEIERRLLAELTAGDLVIFLGGDDLFRFADGLATKLTERKA